MKLRAIFLSLVMVLSVFGGTVAFAGGAAAEATDLSLGSTDVVEGEDVTVSVTDDANGPDGTVYVIADKDGDGEFDDGELIGQATSADSQQDIDADTTDLSGDVDIYAVEETDDPTAGETIDDQQGPSTLSVTPLEVSITPSDATYGDTVNLNVEVTADGEPYENNVYVGVFGLNSDSGNGDNKVLKKGSTTSGSYSTSITLNGIDSSSNLMGNYEVAVRNADSSGDFASTGSAAPSGTSDAQSQADLDATALLDASPDVTVSSVSNTERGASASVSGSVVDYDGSGISDYEVAVRNIDDTSNLATTTTASNGDFSNTQTLADAAQHGVALNLYNASATTAGTEYVAFETFDVTANNQPTEVSAGPTEFPARIQKSADITLDAPTSGSADNVTRFHVSGLELDDLDLTNDGSTQAVIEQITFTDGTTVGEIEDSGNLDGWTSDFGGTAADPNDDSTNELDTATDNRVDTDDTVNIESATILTDTSAVDSNSDAVMNVLAAESGTLTVESQVEDYQNGDDTADTPASPDYTGTTSLTVTEPQDLNVNLNPTSGEIDSDGLGDVETNNLEISILDSNGLGLQESPDADEIQSVTVTLTGTGTQFSADDADGYVDTADTDDDNDVALTESEDNLDSTEFTAEDGDLGTDTQTFEIDSVVGEQNGTIDVSVTADVKGQSEDITGSATYTVTDSDQVSGLPSGEFTVGEEFDLSATLSDGDGQPLNNREITLSSDKADTFQIDTNGDGTYEQTGVENIRLSGADGEAQFTTGGTGVFADDASTGISVNNGEYQLDNVNVTAAGATVDVQVKEGTNSDLQANFPAQFTTSGAAVYDISSDVDTFVAGYEEQVNLTVTRNGQSVNGSTLQRLADTDADATVDNLRVEQQGSSVISGVSTEDTNDDNTVDTIRGTVDADEDGSAAVNISLRTNDFQSTGSTSVAVQAPQVQTNVTNARLTENIQQDVNIEVVDPRDGSTLDVEAVGGTHNPALRVTAFNTTLEAEDLDAGNDFDVDGVSDGTPATPPLFDESNMNNGQANATLMAYPDGDSGPQRLNFEVSFDDKTDYFGSDNVTVEPKQVAATPSSIELGSETLLEVSVEDANGQAIPQQDVALSGAASTSGSTDSSGFVAFTVNPGATGTIDVDVDSDGLDVGGAPSPPASTTDDTVNVTTQQSEFDVSVSPETVNATQPETVTVTATNNASGDAVEGASVEFSGAGVDTSAQTDANGEATAELNASEEGTIDVTVDNAGYNPATATITVNPAPEEPAGDTGSLTFNDQALGDDGTVTVEDVSTGQPSTVVVTYENNSENTVAGTASADNLAGEDVSVTIEDDGGFPGDHTAWVFNTSDLPSDLSIGDDATPVADAALDSETANITEAAPGDVPEDFPGTDAQYNAIDTDGDGISLGDLRTAVDSWGDNGTVGDGVDINLGELRGVVDFWANN